ncbi:unnamed protein product [Ectocarpus sp. 12 AP-2014]
MDGDVGSGSAKPGPTRNSCLNAFYVALGETRDGKSWYTSTKELQLASLEFCMACRAYKTLHLIVDVRIPRMLLAAADGPLRHPKRLSRTRVPRLIARHVTWNMPTAAELRSPIFALMELDHLEFGGAFEGSLEAVTWPRRLESIAFHNFSPFNTPIDLVKWPASLKRLAFGNSFNQPIEHVEFPATSFSPFFHVLTSRLLASFCRLLCRSLPWGQASTIRLKMSRGHRFCRSLSSGNTSISPSNEPSFRHRCRS